MKSSKHFVRFQMAVIETWLVKQCLQCKWSIFFFILSAHYHETTNLLIGLET